MSSLSTWKGIRVLGVKRGFRGGFTFESLVGERGRNAAEGAPCLSPSWVHLFSRACWVCVCSWVVRVRRWIDLTCNHPSGSNVHAYGDVSICISLLIQWMEIWSFLSCSLFFLLTFWAFLDPLFLWLFLASIYLAMTCGNTSRVI